MTGVVLAPLYPIALMTLVVLTGIAAEYTRPVVAVGVEPSVV